MDVNFWTDHSILFFLALILIPRLSLIYFGLIAPLSVSPIVGMMFVPRIMLAISFSAMYGVTNPTLIIFIWVIAIVGDIVDFIIKFSQMKMTYRAQMENMRIRYPDIFGYY